MRAVGVENVSNQTSAKHRSIAFIDLAAQRARIGNAVEAAMARVVEHGQFIMGPEIRELELKLADFCGSKHALTCSSGTDALALVLMGLAVKPGQAVICPSFTFCATAEVVAWLGATPVFCDVDSASFNLCTKSLRDAIAEARSQGLDPVGIIPVDLFGAPADYDPIAAIAEGEGLWILADAAQSFGATYKGRPVGTIARATATSFFPAKPLGCFGDGGAVLTDDDELADRMRSIRVHGQGTHKYDNVRIGMAARMDTLQAAVLIEKLKVFPEEIEARQEVADRYRAQLKDVCEVPEVDPSCQSVWAQYTVKVDPHSREAIQAELKSKGIPTQVYYPLPLHQQQAYASYPVASSGLRASEGLSQSVLSLPMHPYLAEDLQEFISSSVHTAIAAYRG